MAGVACIANIPQLASSHLLLASEQQRPAGDQQQRADAQRSYVVDAWERRRRRRGVCVRVCAVQVGCDKALHRMLLV